MQESFVIRHDLSFPAFFRMNLYLFFRIRIFQRLFVFVTVIGTLSVLLGAATVKNSPTAISIIFQLLQVPASMCGVLFLLLVVTTVILYFFFPHLVRGITYRFTHWGMERVSRTGEFSIPWRDIQQVKETKAYFLVIDRKNPNNIHVLSKQDFTNEIEVVRFRAFVQLHLSVQ